MLEELPGTGHKCIALFPKLREETHTIATLRMGVSQLVRSFDLLSTRYSKKFSEAIRAHKKAKAGPQLFIPYGR